MNFHSIDCHTVVSIFYLIVRRILTDVRGVERIICFEKRIPRGIPFTRTRSTLLLHIIIISPAENSAREVTKTYIPYVLYGCVIYTRKI